MRTNIFKLQVILIVLAFSVAGCNKEEPITDGVPFSDIFSAPKVLVQKNELPEFITVVVDFLEYSPGNWVRVNKGEWINRDVYFVYDMLSSCMFCRVYFGNGEHIIWDNGSYFPEDFSTSKNWVLIYTNKPDWQ
jgi:hypothetical protein